MISANASLALPVAVQLDLRATTAEEAVRELHAGLTNPCFVNDPDKLLRDLLARLNVGSLCLSPDIALPHTRTSAVDDFVFTIGRSSRGIAFDAEHPRVRLVFLVAVQPAVVSEYLRWVAHLSRTLRNPSLRQALLDASTVEEFQNVWALACERLAA